MKDKQKEIIERIKALHPEISGKSLNETIEGILGNFNHTITLETTQHLFTLTAEEVEEVLMAIGNRARDFLKAEFAMVQKGNELEDCWTHPHLVIMDRLVGRIKQWQSENQ